MADTVEKKIDSGNTFFDIFVHTDQIGMEFKADTPEKRKQYVHLSGFRTKIWLKGY